MAFDVTSRSWLRWERHCLEGVRLGRSRDQEAFYRAFAGPLYARVLLPRLGDAAAAEDALVETFRRAFDRIDRYEDRGRSVWGWLATLARRAATDAHRRVARADRALASFEQRVVPLIPEAPRPDRLVEEHLADESRRARVRGVLGAIRPRYRRAIELRLFEERPRQACADAMNVRVATFDVLLLRALRSFRKVWEAHGQEETA